ncbi:MAG: hypothetical protein IKB38_05345 [Clostridia bacterium]|nr:hypothetical protein [Clostridia bacterium]
MKLFFKHLFRSVGKKPLQPLILVLTLSIAITACTLALSIKDALLEEARVSQTSQYGRAEMTVTLNGESRYRFMFARDANRLLGDSGYAFGAYEMILSLGEGDEAYVCSAADLYEINKMFDLSFTSYGEVTDSDLASTAFVTESFADEHGLSVGDSFTARLFSDELVYRVGGISKTAFFGKYNILTDIRAAVRALSESSVIASALGSDFMPSSTLYIDVNEGYTVAECIERLKADPAFAEKTYTDTASVTKGQANVDAMNIAIDMSIVLVALLALAVTFCCFYILGDERREENQSFAYAGATPSYLNIMQLAEVVIYWIFGTLIGVGLSVPLARATGNAVGLRYSVLGVGAGTAAFASAIMLAVSLLTVGIFILSKKKAAKKRKSKLLLPALVSLTVVLDLSVLFVPPAMKIKLSVPGLALTLVCTFVTVGKILCSVMRFISERAERSSRKSAARTYAVKNIISVSILHNAARLSATLVAVVIIATTVIVGSGGNIIAAENVFRNGHVIVGATQKCKEKISSCEEIKSVENVYFSSAQLEEGAVVAAMSVKNKDVVSDEFGISELPKGSGAVISRSIAKRLLLKEGDEIGLVCDNKPLKLRISDIVPSPMSFVLFDCDAVNIAPNLLIPISAEGVTDDEAMRAVSTAIAEDVATVLPTSELLGEKVSTAKVYGACGYALLFIIVTFSVIGLADSLYNSYKRRKSEMELFALSGMSKSEISAMKRFEVFFSLLTGTVIAVALCAAILPIMFEAMLGAGNDVMSGVGTALGL